MKTAMQELIDYVNETWSNGGWEEDIIGKATELLEKEKEQMLNEWQKGFDDAKYIYNQNK